MENVKYDELTKALSSLIDETMSEIEDLKKSRFAAAEIKLEGPGEDTLAGKPVNGQIDAKKAEDDEEDEGVNVEKAEDEEEDEDEDEDEKEDEKKDKKIAQKEVDKHNEKKHGEPKDEDSAFKMEAVELKKSIDAQEQLMKSYVDSKFASLETKITQLTALVDKIADMPVAPKAIPAGIQALAKTEPEVVGLSKSQVIDKLFALKKSGVSVDSTDIFKVETGRSSDINNVVNKYNLK